MNKADLGQELMFTSVCHVVSDQNISGKTYEDSLTSDMIAERQVSGYLL
jgi:hypothetical protein